MSSHEVLETDDSHKRKAPFDIVFTADDSGYRLTVDMVDINYQGNYYTTADFNLLKTLITVRFVADGSDVEVDEKRDVEQLAQYCLKVDGGCYEINIGGNGASKYYKVLPDILVYAYNILKAGCERFPEMAYRAEENDVIIGLNHFDGNIDPRLIRTGEVSFGSLDQFRKHGGLMRHNLQNLVSYLRSEKAI